MFLYTVPFYTLGVLGCFFPWAYSFIPIHASEICLCSFYSKQSNGYRNYLFLHDYDFIPLQIINQLSFYLVNFLFLVGLIVMVYTIRHINDNSKIKLECLVIVAWWMLISLFQFILFTILKISLCDQSKTMWTSKATVAVGYYSTILRDFVTMLITVYYQLNANSEIKLY